MTDEVLLGIVGAVGAMIGNIAVIWRSNRATEKATAAVAQNTEMTGSQQKLTTQIADRADANYKMLKDIMAEFRVQSQEDRDASLTKAVAAVWTTREKTFYARHEELIARLDNLQAVIDGRQPKPVVRLPEATADQAMPDLRGPTKA